MIKRLVKFFQFAVVHSLRDMWRNRSRTVFALVCVATGVAAVVALRTLAFMVGDELTTNLAEVNRGDIRVYASAGVPELVQRSSGQIIFTQEAVDLIGEWAAYEGVDVTYARFSMVQQMKPVREGEIAASAPVILAFVEPDVYPFYGTIGLDDPAGQRFEDVLRYPGDEGPYPVVVSETLTRSTRLNVSVGEMLELGASDAAYVVAAVAEPEAESILSLPQTAIFDYAYLPLEALPLFDEPPLPDQVFIKVPLGRDIRQVEASLIENLQSAFDTTTDFGEELNRASVPELEKQNSETADIIDDMILVMGLSSLLIGGIGIVNTMLVIVSRRTLEIAVLKTLGLKAYRVTALFLVEAVLLGLIGSVIGIVLGVTISYLIRDVGETAFRLSLEWRIYPEALWSGLFLGLLMTGLFGFLPTLIAGQVRPAVVLRPNEAQMPAAGLLQMLVTLVVMLLVFGVAVVSPIVEDALYYGPLYMLIGAGALVGLFGGIIVANTGVGEPLPAHYEFRLTRRFERLEGWLLNVAGKLLDWSARGQPKGTFSPEGARYERGRVALTIVVRGTRQAALLYGALAIGAVIASLIMLITSEMWVPLGLGDSKPANDAYYAAVNGDWAWLLAWVVIVGLLGMLIRWYGRAVAGVIALSSLGITFGGLLGGMLAEVLERIIGATPVWQTLEDISTGVVLVEGVMAALGGVFVAYWLLVWAIGKLPPVALMGLVSVVLVSLGIGLVAGAALISETAVIVVVVGAAVGGVLLYFRVWERWLPAHTMSYAANGHVASVVEIAHTAARGTSTMLFGVMLLGGGFLLVDVTGVWGFVLLSVALVLVLWRTLRRTYTIDGRLILRQMAGRRGRVASTLLGLSVGIAGLSLVSLTTGAVSHLLRVQLDESVEGNLLVVGTRPEYGREIGVVLSDQEGIDSYSQVTNFIGTLISIDGEPVEVRNPHRRNEVDNPGENSNSEMTEEGVRLILSERVNIADLPEYTMKEGRRLAMEDVGLHRVMIRESYFQEEYNIHEGSRLLFRFENDPGEEDDVLLQLRVVGVVARNSEQTGLEAVGNVLSVPPGTLVSRGVHPTSVAAIVQVNETDREAVDRVKAAVTEVPGVIAIELSALTQLLEGLLDQLKAIPTLVAWLALLAGTAIIANTVALATQERRRQIGVMKAVGLKGRRVLGMLMIENGLIGLIAGLIGVGVGFVATVALVLASPNPDELQRTIEYPTMGWLIIMSIGVAIGAATFSAWNAAAEKPMNVLRYE